MKKRVFLLCGLLMSLTFSAFAQFEVFVTTGNGLTSSSVKKYDPNGVFLGDFIAAGTSPLDWPQDIVFIDNDATALVSGLNNNAIFRYDGVTGAFIDTFASNISGPTRMKIGADGYLYALEWSGGGRVMRYDLTGNFIDTFTNIAVTASIGLDWDSIGNLYVSSYNGNAIYRFDPSGNFIDIPISSGLSGPTTIWFDSIGDLYVCNWNGNFIKRFDASFTLQPSNFGSISKPEGYATLPNGDILLGSGGPLPSSTVRRYDSQGNYIAPFAIASGLLNPNAIYVKTTVVGLNEGNVVPQLVYPSIGTRFYIADFSSLNQNKILLTGMNGQVVKQIFLGENGFFDTGELSNGVYFVSLDNGKSQRIIVEK